MSPQRTVATAEVVASNVDADQTETYLTFLHVLVENAESMELVSVLTEQLLHVIRVVTL